MNMLWKYIFKRYYKIMNLMHDMNKWIVSIEPICLYVVYEILTVAKMMTMIMH